jgi:hypothetical protein
VQTPPPPVRYPEPDTDTSVSGGPESGSRDKEGVCSRSINAVAVNDGPFGPATVDVGVFVGTFVGVLERVAVGVRVGRFVAVAAKLRGVRVGRNEPPACPPAGFVTEGRAWAVASDEGDQTGSSKKKMQKLSPASAMSFNLIFNCLLGRQNIKSKLLPPRSGVRMLQSISPMTHGSLAHASDLVSQESCRTIVGSVGCCSR